MTNRATSPSENLRTPPRQARSEATVVKILESANALFAEHGPSATTTTNIAKQAGVSVGSLYHFFPDKLAIARALGELYHEDMAQMLEPLVGDVSDASQFPTFASKGLRGAAAVVQRHPGYLRVVDETDSRVPESPLYQLRSQLSLLLHKVAPSIGLGHVSMDELNLMTEFVIDVCATMLRRLPPDEPARTRGLAELELLFTSYVLARARPEAQDQA